MKFLAIFAAVVAVASAYNVVHSTGLSVSEWTLNDLSAALQNPDTDPAVKPYLVEALNELMTVMYAGSTQNTISVVLPAMDVSIWTLQELDQALADPSLNPDLKPYLVDALNHFMEALYAGQHNMEDITITTPAGLIPIPAHPEPSPVVVPSPVLPEPSPVVVPTPVETESSPASSPLVQLIINVNAQQKPQPVADAVLPSPAIVPEAVVDAIAPSPAIVPEAIVEMPVVVNEPIIVSPEPVQVAEPIIVPEPVQVANPVLPSPNPIDIIAVAAPEVNPVDLISPVPVAPETAAGDVVGPLV